MKLLNAKMLATLAASLCLLGAAGCTEDNPSPNGGNGNGTNPPTGSCTEGEINCYGNSLVQCVGGQYQTTDCAASNQICSANQCVAKPQTGNCDASAAPICSGNMLTSCVNGQWNTINCADSNQVCSNGACAASGSNPGPGPNPSDPNCNATDPAKCDGNAVMKCVDSKWVQDKVCGANEICSAGACQAQAADASGIGNPCKCVSNCEFQIDLSGTKISIPASMTGMPNDLPIDVGAFLNNEPITGPNFLAGKTEGCENIKPIPGATIACMWDYTVKLPATLSGIIPVISVIPAVQEAGVDFAPITDMVNKGIQFTAPNGYCIATAINIEAATNADSGDLEKQVVELLNDKVKPITTGDASKFTSCPADSELIKFDVDTSKEEKDPESKFNADFKVGFAICAKKCATDNDCRKAEGYSCTEIPSGDGTTKHVCFDKSNIDRFSALENAIPKKDEK